MRYDREYYQAGRVLEGAAYPAIADDRREYYRVGLALKGAAYPAVTNDRNPAAGQPPPRLRSRSNWPTCGSVSLIFEPGRIGDELRLRNPCPRQPRAARRRDA